MGKYREVNDELVALVAEHKSGKEISRILSLDYSTVHAKLRKLGLNLHNYHNELKFDNTVFDVIDSEEKAYWLGFLYADGSVSSRSNTVELSLKGEDRNHLEKFKNFLKCRREIKVSQSKIGDKIYTRCRYSVTDLHFKERLVELGCLTNKSLTLQFPNASIFKEKSLILDFIRGYVDGDGYLGFTKSGRLQLEIIGTKEFLQGMLNFLSLPATLYYKDKRTKHNTYFISITCNKADYVAKLLYGKATIYLERKYNRFCRAVQ